MTSSQSRRHSVGRALATLGVSLVLAACSDTLNEESPAARYTEEPQPYSLTVAGALTVQVLLASDLPVRGVSVGVHAAGGAAVGPRIATDANGRGAVYRAMEPGSELRATFDQDGVRGTLRARVDQWDGVAAQTLDPITTLRAAWRDANPASTPIDANVAVRALLGIPERVPDAQLMTATKWFSGRAFIAAAQGGDFDRLVSAVVALPPSDTPRFGDPAGADAKLQSSGTSVLGWLIEKAKDNAFSGVIGVAQFGFGLYSKDQEKEALEEKFRQVNEKLDDLRKSVDAIGVSTSASLAAILCNQYSAATNVFDTLVSRLDEMRRLDGFIEALRKENLTSLPDLIKYPYDPSVVRTMSPEALAKYNAVPASQAYRDLQLYREQRRRAFEAADAEANRVQFPSSLVGNAQTEATGALQMLATCILSDRTYLTAADQQVLRNEIQLRAGQAAYLQIARLETFDAENAEALLAGSSPIRNARAEIANRLNAIKAVLEAGAPSHDLERSTGDKEAPAETWLIQKNVILRVAEQAPIFAFELMLHRSKAENPGTSFDGGRHLYRLTNFNPANTRGERQLGADEHVLFEVPPSPREQAACSASGTAASCPGTLRDWLLRSTGGAIGQDVANLDRFDLFKRSVALAGLGNVYWTPLRGGERYYYAYYRVFDLVTWSRRKVVLYNEDRNIIRKACLGGWSGSFGYFDLSLSRDFQEYPDPRPYTIQPPAGYYSLTQQLFADTQSHACLHSTRDHFASRLVTVRPVQDTEHLLWSSSKAKAKLRDFGRSTL